MRSFLEYLLYDTVEEVVVEADPDEVPDEEAEEKQKAEEEKKKAEENELVSRPTKYILRHLRSLLNW